MPRPLPPTRMPMPRPTPGPSMPPSAPRAPRPRPGVPTMPSYKKGGIVKKTGPALVHKGEKIIPVKKVAKKK